jgi:uncharacterized delta-60 repeat protein
MTKRLVVMLLIAAAGVAMTAPSRAAGTAGALDPSFGRGGRLVSAFGVTDVGDSVIQPDGKIVVAATIGNIPGAIESFGIVRYLPNGLLDLTFGHQGITTGQPINQYNFSKTIAVQADRKIVVVGNTLDPRVGHHPSFGIGLARYNAVGTLDRSFGSGGLITVAYPGSTGSYAGALIVQRDGKIVIGGLASLGGRPATTVERLNQNGSVDTTFGSGGAFESPGTAVNALALLPDGSILALAGTSAVHLSSKGTLLPNASGSVIAAAHTGPSTFLQNGQFAVAQAQVEFNDRFDLDILPVRFNIDGSVDTTFLSSAFDFTGEGPDALQSNPRAIAQQADGSILVGGSETSGCCSSLFGLARMTSGGPLDPNFGTGGVVTTTFNTTDTVDSLIVQRDGKIVAVGHTVLQTGFRLAIARYLGR